MQANVNKELIDTILVMKNERLHANNPKKKNLGKTAHRAPAPVAMPFPPLKPKKGVKICPKIDAKPIHSMRLSRGQSRETKDGAKKTGQ